jgi:Arc/MetJ-type ribon-helix-helix transcriptional regulator
VFKVNEYSESDAVRIAVRILWHVTQDTVDYALRQREKADAELAEFRQSRKLSSEAVDALSSLDTAAWEEIWSRLDSRSTDRG